MLILLWRVLDNRVVEACLGPALVLAGLALAALLLPEGSGLEAAAEFFAFGTTLMLMGTFLVALFRRR